MLYITESGSRDWWKNMKKIMGLDGNSKSCIEQLANNTIPLMAIVPSWLIK